MILLVIHTTLGECQKLSCSNPPEKQESDDTLNVNSALRNIVLKIIHQVIHPLCIRKESLIVTALKAL